MVGVTGSIPVAPTTQSSGLVLVETCDIGPLLAGFFVCLRGLSVPVGVLGRFGATVSARKNPVPGGLAFALAKERRKTDDSVF